MADESGAAVLGRKSIVSLYGIFLVHKTTCKPFNRISNRFLPSHNRVRSAACGAPCLLISPDTQQHLFQIRAASNRLLCILPIRPASRQLLSRFPPQLQAIAETREAIASVCMSSSHADKYAASVFPCFPNHSSCGLPRWHSDTTPAPATVPGAAILPTRAATHRPAIPIR